MEKWIVNPVGGHVVRCQVEKAKTGPVAGKAMDSEVFTHRSVDWIYLTDFTNKKPSDTNGCRWALRLFSCNYFSPEPALPLLRSTLLRFYT